jgi:hypothetical protein
LNLGESLSPVLIAKVQHGAPHPQTVLERFTIPGDESEEDEDNLASDFESQDDDVDGDKGAWMGDVEWIAFEVLEDDDSDVEDDEDAEDDSETDTGLLPAMSSLTINSSPVPSPPPTPLAGPSGISLEQRHSSLSLLEYLLRLSALQTFEQQSHMNLTDEHIVLFLRDDNPAPRQQQSFEPQPPRRRSSIVSISSDFSTRGNRRITGLPLSPPRSDEMEPRGNTPSSIHSTPMPEPEPRVVKNPRTQLERAMAADYDPMTLLTPPRRVTRNGRRKPLIAPKEEPHGSNSAPGSLQRNYAGATTGDKSGANDSPLAGKADGARRSASSGHGAFRKAGRNQPTPTDC